MAECKRLDFGCRMAERGQEAAGDMIDSIIADITDAIEQSVRMLSTFWVDVPTIGFSGAGGVTEFLSTYLDPYVTGFVVLSIIIGSIKLIFSHNSEPGRELAGGLIRVVAVGALAIPMVSMLTTFTDQVSKGIIDSALQGSDFGENLWLVMSITSGGNPIFGLFASIMVGLLAVPTAIIQACLMIIRAILLPILAGTLTLSAAFFTTELGRQWFQKSLVWLVAFLAYKPAAAIIYASGFVMMGNTSLGNAESKGEFAIALLNFIQGFGLMLLAVVSLGALLGFVVPVSGKLAGSGSGMMFAASAGGVIAAGAISNGFGGREAPMGEISPPLGSRGDAGTNGAQGPGGATPNTGSTPSMGGGGGAGGVPSGMVQGVQVITSTAQGMRDSAEGTIGKDDK